MQTVLIVFAKSGMALTHAINMRIYLVRLLEDKRHLEQDHDYIKVSQSIVYVCVCVCV